jgi:hypothetical protein
MDERRSQRNKKDISYVAPAVDIPSDAPSPKKQLSADPAPDPTRPRWYNAPYLVLMSLREAREPLARGELIRRALELDQKISKERGLPPCFGEDGDSQCGIVLRDNKDGYFHAYKPPGSKSHIYSLAYEPSSFENARLKYEEWTRRLVKYDWPIMFGPSTWYDEPEDKKMEPTPVDTETTAKAQTPLVDTRTAEEAEMVMQETIEVQGEDDDSDFEEETRTGKDRRVIEGGDQQTPQKSRATGDPFSPIHVMERIYVYRPDGVCTRFKRKRFGRPSTKDDEAGKRKLSDDAEEPHAKKLKESTDEKAEEVKDESTDIPASWEDILRVDISSIPNAGRGVFARQILPKYLILGFYFGVPMTEDEFDERKDHVGVASQYSVRFIDLRV